MTRRRKNTNQRKRRSQIDHHRWMNRSLHATVRMTEDIESEVAAPVLPGLAPAEDVMTAAPVLDVSRRI